MKIKLLFVLAILYSSAFTQSFQMNFYVAHSLDKNYPKQENGNGTYENGGQIGCQGSLLLSSTSYTLKLTKYGEPFLKDVILRKKQIVDSWGREATIFYGKYSELSVTKPKIDSDYKCSDIAVWYNYDASMQLYSDIISFLGCAHLNQEEIKANVDERIKREAQIELQKELEERKEKAHYDEVFSKIYDLEIYDKYSYSKHVQKLEQELIDSLRENAILPSFEEIALQKNKFIKINNIYNIEYELSPYGMYSSGTFSLVSGNDSLNQFINRIESILPHFEYEGYDVITKATVKNLNVEYIKGYVEVKIEENNVTFLSEMPSEKIVDLLMEKLKKCPNGKFNIKYEVGRVKNQSFVFLSMDEIKGEVRVKVTKKGKVKFKDKNLSNETQLIIAEKMKSEHKGRYDIKYKIGAKEDTIYVNIDKKRHHSRFVIILLIIGVVGGYVGVGYLFS